MDQRKHDVLNHVAQVTWQLNFRRDRDDRDQAIMSREDWFRVVNQGLYPRKNYWTTEELCRG